MRETITWLKTRKDVWEAKRASMPPERRGSSFNWRELLSFTVIMAIFTAGGRYYEVRETKKDLKDLETKVEEKLEPAVTDLEKKDIELGATLKSIEKEMGSIHSKIDGWGKRMTAAIINARSARRARRGDGDGG